MRHRWNHKLNRKDKYATCIKCGCVKEKYYGVMLYFTYKQKDPFLKAPKCDKPFDYTTAC